MDTGPEQLQSVEVSTYLEKLFMHSINCLIRDSTTPFVLLFTIPFLHTAPGVPNNPNFQLDDAVCGKITISWDEPLEDEQIGKEFVSCYQWTCFDLF